MRSARENLKFLDDLAKAATGAIGSFAEMRAQVKHLVKESVDRVVSELDMVSRAEFERVEGMARKARERQEQLEKRLAALEKQLKTKKTAGKKK
jgi:BMFP domain-containing protein YqiC